nr:hypothetical protein XAC439_100009 [Xanthomonas citri pv. citri]
MEQSAALHNGEPVNLPSVLIGACGALAHSDMRAAAGQRRQPGGLARSQAMLSGSLADPAQGASENGSHQFIVGTGPNDRGPAMYRGHVVADGLAPHPCCRLDLSILHRRS